MKITYTGRHDEFLPKQREKLEAKLAKIAKMMERKGERRKRTSSSPRSAFCIRSRSR